ncbi:hypothetical protein BOA8489_03780 [Boseongicola aestuarii]|uniref:Uncharacterized protein n=1 Tax=Boseongicola aestuarii TaxID=1470561 RepID=A0A238J4P7_9RHOB|nr:hypothetical protein BOA8489_03780 [Boseongicola aestuarii]
MGFCENRFLAVCFDAGSGRTRGGNKVAFEVTRSLDIGNPLHNDCRKSKKRPVRTYYKIARANISRTILLYQNIRRQQNCGLD